MSEIADIKQRREVVEASLELNGYVEDLRNKFKLSPLQIVVLLQEQAQIYLKAVARRALGKR
jgi:hypothetical protein